ncbi:hypothetical protein GCM10011611_11430 [Aliidongia dinghuensis]|uniref:Uncharacterized protein n=1 Tax=Aliidongia dinghuensis TaxID=1867774 RepID=A0A8J2YR25_9PROT|nr:hypothetical protein GCM10011611_11430 [Aliidongia dinghuensis]
MVPGIEPLVPERAELFVWGDMDHGDGLSERRISLVPKMACRQLADNRAKSKQTVPQNRPMITPPPEVVSPGV